MSKSRDEKKAKKSSGGDDKDRVEKKIRKEKKEKKKQRSAKEEAAFSLLVEDKQTNPTLSSLFAAKPTPPQPKAAAVAISRSDDEGFEDEDEGSEEIGEVKAVQPADDEDEPMQDEGMTKRRRKRKRVEAEVEDLYMRRLAIEEEKDAEDVANQRASKRSKSDSSDDEGAAEDGDDIAVDGKESDDDIAEDDEMSPPPKHETQEAADAELSKANRTVFLGNVSTSAMTSKSAKKELLRHLASFFPSLPAAKPSDASEPTPAVESLRFRSTPYATTIPKKAAYATKQLMPTTTQCTNAYAVYTSERLAREAVKHLNATVVLSRHLRVDSVAHPSPTEPRRCVFIGGLAFVDDDSNINAANAAEGKETRKPSKTPPGDVEEGLWRTFAKCGTVESVRVLRDGKTRVGKGVAYVQFTSDVAVEAALALNGKKFPPMLPRSIRVARAKAQKRNAKPGSGRPGAKAATGYQRKVTGEEKSKVGRTGKLFGRAAAAKVRKDGVGSTGTAANAVELGERGAGIRKPEEFVFEGYRARREGGKAGLKLGGRKKKGGKVTGRSRSFKAKPKSK